NGYTRLYLAVGAAGGAESVVLGNGDGSFRAARSFSAGSGPWSVAEGDFNGDGIPDLVTEGSVLLGNGDGSFQAPLTFSAGDRPRFVAVGDFNGDGLLDLAGTAYGNSELSVLLGN